MKDFFYKEDLLSKNIRRVRMEKLDTMIWLFIYTTEVVSAKATEIKIFRIWLI